MKAKRVLSIRLSSKHREREKSFIYDLAQFQNLLRIFILEWNRKTDDIFRLFNPSLWHSLIADRIQSNESGWQRKELEAEIGDSKPAVMQEALALKGRA